MNRKKPDLHQANIQTLFQVASKQPVAKTDSKPSNCGLLSDKPDIQAFYNSLNPAEKIAHSIAIEQLGTSYNVERTHGYIKWKKAQST